MNCISLEELSGSHALGTKNIRQNCLSSACKYLSSSPIVRLVNHCFRTCTGRTSRAKPFTGHICLTVLDKDDLCLFKLKRKKELTSTASEKMKNATKTKNNPFTKPAITSARPYLEVKRELLVCQWFDQCITKLHFVALVIFTFMITTA